MNTKDQIVCSWGGVAFMIVFLIGWGILSGYLPPHSPNMTAAEVVSFYQQNPVRIRLGLVITLLGTVFLIPFSAVISAQMAKIEGTFPVWSYTQLASAAGTVITFIIPIMMWEVASFRLDRNPELIQLMHDLGWIPMVAATSPYWIAPLAIARVGFMDKSKDPIFPRWACFYNIWVAILVIPGCIIIMFKTGPFAWDGLLAWWLPLVDFGIWFGVMTYLLVKGIKRQALAAR